MFVLPRENQYLFEWSKSACPVCQFSKTKLSYVYVNTSPIQQLTQSSLKNAIYSLWRAENTRKSEREGKCEIRKEGREAETEISWDKKILCFSPEKVWTFLRSQLLKHTDPGFYLHEKCEKPSSKKLRASIREKQRLSKG